MRSSVSVILSSPAPDTSMSHPDYDQSTYDHASLLILTKQIGDQAKQKPLGRVLERLSRVGEVKVVDAVGVTREIKARYIKEYPVENNDWGDYQTHRRLLGLISIGKYETQQELNELCRVHETLKVKYTSTLYDSRCILIGPEANSSPTGESGGAFSTPSNFKARAIFYADSEACSGLEEHVSGFLLALFWVLESKRLERSREKIDRVSLLQAPFEKRDFVGLDLESRTNKKRCMGRMTKHLGDLSLQAGLPSEALGFYTSAVDILKAVNDWLWLGGAIEGLCAASVVVLYPNLNRNYPLQRNASLQESSPCKQRSSSFSTNSLPSGILSGSASPEEQQEIQNVLLPEDILKRYCEAIIHYSKYLNAGIIETEACFKAARVAVEQGYTLQAASFLQNVVFINLALSESQKIQRFTCLSELYIRIGFHRKASLCRRLAATRHVSAQNSQPNWSQCYQLMLQALAGHKLTLDPTEFPRDRTEGWPALQIQLLQELVVAARRMGHSALATRHMTFLLQTLWDHLVAPEQRDLALQLQVLSAQCEGSPVPLVLPSGTVIPPANLINIPRIRNFTLQNVQPYLRPQKIEKLKEDCGPFLFTPIHFGSLERKSNVAKSKMEYVWVEGDPCEVALELWNPLPFELKVSNMRLLTNGPVFESMPSSLVLPAESGPHPLTLAGIPKETGELELLGYSTHTLGVKSNCRLRNMTGFLHPHYSIDVIPALPQMQVSTSLPKSSSLSPPNNLATVVTSASISLFAGESAECTVTLSNVGQQTIEVVEVSVQSMLEQSIQQQVFQWSQENLQAQLPLTPGASASFTIYLFSVADFLRTSSYMDQDGSSFMYGSQPTSFVSGPSSLPSRLGSPTWDRDQQSARRNELTSSIRSNSSYRSGSSLSSSQFPLSKLIAPQTSKVLEGQIKLKYSGGPGLVEGYCRVCSVGLSIEMLPSIQITNWDVLPAETNSQFYLVLDVANLTSHELDLQYTPSKCILIEGYESCRIPVPVNRCPLSKLAKLYNNGCEDGDEALRLENICSEHIASLVDLRWHISSSDKSGKISLKGLNLSSEMLDIVRMSPLQWEVMVDSEPVKPQEELSCVAGQCLQLSISVHNFLERSLWQVALAVQFYQDHQNGVNNYRLETRLASAGASKVILPELVEQGSVHHECSVVFFTPGQYKVDIHCSTQDNPSADTTCQVGHTWKFIPPVAITVLDV